MRNSPKNGFEQVRVFPGPIYQARAQSRIFRFMVGTVKDGNVLSWVASVEEEQRDGTWRTLDLELYLPSQTTQENALHDAITKLAKLVAGTG